MLKRTWQKLIIGDMTPFAIALGIALGTFAALLPTFGFSILIAIGLTAILPRVNKPAVLVALAFWNPLVQIPVYALSFEIGSFLFSGTPIVHYNFELLNHLYSFTRRVFVGQLIVAVTFTALAYIITYTIVSIMPIFKNSFRFRTFLPTQLRTAKMPQQ